MDRFKHNFSIHSLGILVLLLGLIVALGACSVLPDKQTKAKMPEVTIEFSDAGLAVPEEIPSGVVAVSVKNTSAEPQDLALIRLREGQTLEEFTSAMGEGEEVFLSVAFLGGQGVMPGATQREVFDLQSGTYVVGNFGAEPALLTSFEAGTRSGASAPSAEYQVDLLDYAFAMPAEIKAGPHLWQIANKGKQVHNIAILKLDEGVTAQDLVEATSAGEELDGAEWVTMFWSPVGAGERAWNTLDLAPGTYAVVCFMSDLGSESAKMHLELGMVHTLTVTN